MGDNFLKEQVRNAKRRRDRVKVEDGKPSLFKRPEIVNTTYPITPTNGHEFQPGETIWGVATRKGDHIDVTDGHKRLGTSEGEPAKKLHHELSKQNGSTAIKMRIVEVGKLSGVAQAQVVSDGEGQ